jgi:hypothetical protein
MSTGTTGNFIEGGGDIDPFTGRAPGQPPTLAEQAAAEDARRQRELQATARNTANINNRPGGFMSTRETGPGEQINPATGKPWTGRERPKPTGFWEGIGPTLEAISKDPVTMGILLGPYATVGAGLAAGGPAALGFGEGAAAGGGGSVPAGYAIKDTVAPTITRTASAFPGGIGVPGTAATATAATAPAAAAPAVAGTAGGMTALDYLGKYGPGALLTAAPFAINALTGGRTKEEKALLAKQEQMAKEAEAERYRQQEARMNALGQQLLAFNPTNEMMAKIYGPQAAFQPQEMAQMTQNPMPPPELPPELQGKEGMAAKDPAIQAKFREYLMRKQQYEQGNQQRNDMMMNGVRAPGPGPAPLQQRTPQDARKY